MYTCHSNHKTSNRQLGNACASVTKTQLEQAVRPVGACASLGFVVTGQRPPRSWCSEQLVWHHSGRCVAASLAFLALVCVNLLRFPVRPDDSRSINRNVWMHRATVQAGKIGSDIRRRLLKSGTTPNYARRLRPVDCRSDPLSFWPEGSPHRLHALSLFRAPRCSLAGMAEPYIDGASSLPPPPGTSGGRPAFPGLDTPGEDGLGGRRSGVGGQTGDGNAGSEAPPEAPWLQEGFEQLWPHISLVIEVRGEWRSRGAEDEKTTMRIHVRDVAARQPAVSTACTSADCVGHCVLRVPESYTPVSRSGSN